jgi:rod shape-determining protein MreC
MRNLFRFLLKQNFVLLFLLLGSVSMWLLTKSHTYHRAAIINSSSNFTGGIMAIAANIGDYFKLKEANNQLAEQNARLQEQLYYYEQLTDSLSEKPLDSTGFEYIPARVVSNTVHLRNNYIVINKGSKHGIEKEMGLVSPTGIAGIVIGVSENYATALSVLHTHARLSIKFSNNNQLANLVWRGPDYKMGTVEDIPTHLRPVPGDTLVTSGHSFLFPEGVVVGTVVEYVEQQGRGLNEARILFSTDFNKLKYVYVVSNRKQDEIEALIKLNVYE